MDFVLVLLPCECAHVCLTGVFTNIWCFNCILFPFYCVTVKTRRLRLKRLQSAVQILLSAPLLCPPRSSSLCRLSQASNGNDPWSAWNADSVADNNWASNPEAAQSGKGAAEPWGSTSHGHPQAYQGPGRGRGSGSEPVGMSLSGF